MMRQEGEMRPEQEGTSAPVIAGAMNLRPSEEMLRQTYTVGMRIAWARQRRGLTQRQLSELLGKARATVIQYEQGRLQPPLVQIEALAKALDVSPEFIAFGREGVAGLGSDNSKVLLLPEVEIEEEEKTLGAYALPETLAQHLGIAPDAPRVLILPQHAPAFGFIPGDRLIVTAESGLVHAHRLYVLRTSSGIEVVRLLPNLVSDELVKLNGSNGEVDRYRKEDLSVVGMVVGVIKAA